MHEGTIDVGGRQLGFADHGVPDGIPIVGCHGIPGSRHHTLDQAALEDAGARLIMLERPGFGLSDPLPGRRLLDWPKDVAAAADHLGLDTFAVMGISMGGPNALACGHSMPDRVAVVGLVCAVGPVFDHPEFDALLAGDLPALLGIARADLDGARLLLHDFLQPTSDAVNADIDTFFDEVFVDGWQESDRPYFVEHRDLWLANLEATHRRGPETLTDEYASSCGPWGFEPADVRSPVRAFHGDLDEIPAAMIRYVVDEVPDGDLVIHLGEAHALADSHHPEWIAALTAWAR